MRITPVARFAAGVIAVALLATACTSKGGDNDATTPAATTTAPPSTTSPEDAVAAAQKRVDDAQTGVAGAQDALTKAGTAFCGQAGDYVEALDRYGKLFTDQTATVGDVKTAGADLAAPRDSVKAAGSDVESAKTALAEADQELIDAQAALAVVGASASSKPVPTTTAATATTTTFVAAATLERVQQAEKDMTQAEEGITDATPLTEATAEFNSAAFALQITWLQFLSEAGCFSDEQQAKAVEQVTAYTKSLQTELKQLGYYEGEIDGIYGPDTVAAVKKLQKDAGLTETGFVDMATAAALQTKLDALGQQAAAAEMTQTATVQTVLTLTGFWTGPVDGKWTDELTDSLKAFQTELGVKPTGEVDAATLEAFQQALAEQQASATSSPSAPVTVTATAATTATTTATATATATAPVTVTATASPSAPATVTVTATASASTSAGADLAGDWTGKYSGAATGTFELTLKQNGSKLTGTITLSDPATTVDLNGTLKGDTIEFGTVGGTEITFTGTVDGDSMSGTYSVSGAPGGDWSATRS